jgi:hypothetical protein
VDGHDLEVGVGGVDVGEGVEALEGVVEAGEVGDPALLFEFFELVEVALGVFELGLVGDAGGAAEGEPGAFDALAQAAALAVGDGGGEDAGEVGEEEVVRSLPDGLKGGAGDLGVSEESEPWGAGGRTRRCGRGVRARVSA